MVAEEATQQEEAAKLQLLAKYQSHAKADDVDHDLMYSLLAEICRGKGVPGSAEQRERVEVQGRRGSFLE